MWQSILCCQLKKLQISLSNTKYTSFKSLLKQCLSYNSMILKYNTICPETYHRHRHKEIKQGRQPTLTEGK